MRRFSRFAVVFAVSFFSWGPKAVAAEAEWSSDGSIVLDNGDARVVISPAKGGRVMEYSWKGKNALEPVEAGPGRFDIGPEKVIPKRRELWEGPWKGETTGGLSARVTSVEHEATGVQLVRDYALDSNGSRFIATQTIVNISDKRVHWNHWSRTFAKGGGICLVPLSEYSAYPNQYIMYQGDGRTIDYRPEDPNIEIRDGFFILKGPPRFPKLGLDSHEGWMTYLSPNDLAFIKKFPTYPNRRYWEMIGMTISLWYVENRASDNLSTCELEPIGPREDIGPDESASFTEEWFLEDYQFPENDPAIDVDDIKAMSLRAMRKAR